MIYRFIAKFLIKSDPTLARTFLIKYCSFLNLFSFFSDHKRKDLVKPRRVLSYDFVNPIGLASGIDYSGKHLDALSKHGFGFIELGPVTPKTEHFRICNSVSVDTLIQQLSNIHVKSIVGACLQPNNITPQARVVDDYSYLLRKIYPYVSFVTIDISIKNIDQYVSIIETLSFNQKVLQSKYSKKVSLIVRINNTVDKTALIEIVKQCMSHSIDGIAVNKPEDIFEYTQGDIPIICVEEICKDYEVSLKFRKGADLLQLRDTYLINGPGIIKDLIASSS